jgi:protein arginine kinase activator
MKKMLCEKCKKRTATVFYNENINGKAKSFSLCGECAAKLREMGDVQDITSMIGSFADPFSNLHDDLFGGFFGIPSHAAKLPKKCPNCEATYAEISKYGKVGCPNCYEVFRDELASLIASVHGTTSHTGKVPARHRAKKERDLRLKDLKEQLQAAIQSEAYEKAAELRDEIKKMQHEDQKEGE